MDDIFVIIWSKMEIILKIHKGQRWDWWNISKMLRDYEYGFHAELVAFSELYNVQIQVFDLFSS